VLQPLRELIYAEAPALRHRVFTDDTPLMSGGLGFDSIGVLELLLACETHFGLSLVAERFLEKPLTVGTLASEIAEARSNQG
jgi:acyl carrier protein